MNGNIIFMFSFILLSGCGLLINKREAKQEAIKLGMTFANVQQILINNQIPFEKVDEAIDELVKETIYSGLSDHVHFLGFLNEKE